MKQRIMRLKQRVISYGLYLCGVERNRGERRAASLEVRGRWEGKRRWKMPITVPPGLEKVQVAVSGTQLINLFHVGPPW